MRLKLLCKIDELSASYHDNAVAGETVFRIEQDVYNVGEFGGEALVSFGRSFTMTAIILAVMLVINARLTLVVVPLIPVFIYLRRRCYTMLRRWTDLVQEESSRRTSFVQEHVTAVLQLQHLNRERTEAIRFLRVLRAARDAQFRCRNTELTLGIASLLIVVAGGSLVLAYGGFRVISGGLTVGALVAFYNYVVRLFDPISSAVDIDIKLARARSSARRILELLGRPSDVADNPGAKRLARVAGAIEYDSVSFGYNADRIVLNDLKFRINPGERVALVGRSGSGKSTLAKLLLRQYEATGGHVCLDGTDVRDIRLRDLRAAIALIPQDAVLLHATFRQNLLLGNPAATQKECDAALDLAQLTETVRSFPRGFDEIVGPRGARLSGGERQRLAIARAVLRDPQVLFLDESTSAMDAATEQALLAGLDRRFPNRTILVVAHRASTVFWAHRILVVDRGRIEDEGSHTELLMRSEVYRALYWEQLVKEDQGSGLNAGSSRQGREQPVRCELKDAVVSGGRSS